MNNISEGIVYARPKTRGELRDLLNKRVSCEVASYVLEMTAHMLKGWLGFSNFNIRPSENAGWSVFEYHIDKNSEILKFSA